MENKVKMIAAVSAVMHYLKEEEEAICLQASAQPQVPAPVAAVAASGPAVSQWALGGRYDHMQTRAMMQMKAFHR